MCIRDRFYVIHPTLENFSDLSKLLSNMWVPLSRYLFNSVFVSAVATVGCIVFTVMAAFVITKHDIPGKKLIDFLIVNAILFTGKVIGVPQYIVCLLYTSIFSGMDKRLCYPSQFL